MATAVIMPRQGQSVESCIIAKWHRQKGDKVAVGDPLFTYETDKATFEEESKTEGVMLEIFFEEGDDVECLKNVCVIGQPGESTAEFAPDGAAAQGEENAKAEPVAEAPQAVELGAVAEPVSSDEMMRISPRARALAQKSGADIRYAQPTGANGRIMERDVQQVLQGGHLVTSAAKDAYGQAGSVIEGTGLGGRVTTGDLAAPVAQPVVPTAPQADFEEVKLPNIRKVIAKAMHASLANSAQLTLNSSFDATAVLEYRKLLKAKAESLGLPNITLNDMILYVVSRALLNHPEVNAHFYDDKMLLFKNAHIGIATDTPRGLLVPTLFSANQLGLSEIAKASKSLTEQAKQGTISPDLIKGGTFTVTNLGTLGVESFTPVINPPQTCILGVCCITERTKQGKTYPCMGLSLTFDHRALDGAPAARFLQEVADGLENFGIFLAL